MNHIIRNSMQRNICEKTKIMIHSQRFVHPTPACHLAPRRGKQTRHKSRQQSSKNNEKRTKSQGSSRRNIRKSESLLDKRKMHYTQSVRKKSQINSTSTEEANIGDRAYLQLASQWTKQSFITSEHPAVQQILKDVK